MDASDEGNGLKETAETTANDDAEAEAEAEAATDDEGDGLVEADAEAEAAAVEDIDAPDDAPDTRFPLL